MFFIAYNIVSLFLLVPVLLFHAYQRVSGAKPPALSRRFGRIPANDLAVIANRPVIWVHAVSVGEAMAARPLLAALRAQYRHHCLLISCSTENGRAVAERFGEKDICISFPFDFLPAVRHVLDAVRPELIIIMETEIWPNFIHEAAKRRIPLILANGRISDRSFSRYRTFSWVFRPALQLFSGLCMQTAIDRERIIAIGAPAERCQTAGNIKYDIPYRQLTDEDKMQRREQYAIPSHLTVLTAGSTRPGEEELLLEMYRHLLVGHDDLFLVLVPRHPERTGEIAALAGRQGIAYRCRTALQEGDRERFRSGEVLLVDTVGEMMSMYELADVAFVGGSLVPLGGHNMLEPASRGIPTVFGPYTGNFRDAAALVRHYQAGIQLQSPHELTDACRRLLDDRELRRQLGANGITLMAENCGTTKRHLEIITRYL